MLVRNDLEVIGRPLNRVADALERLAKAQERANEINDRESIEKRDKSKG